MYGLVCYVRNGKKNTNDNVIQDKISKAPIMSFISFAFLNEISITVPVMTIIIMMNQGT